MIKMIKLVKSLFTPCKSPLQRGREWAVEIDLETEWERGSSSVPGESCPYPPHTPEAAAWERGRSDMLEMLEILSV